MTLRLTEPVVTALVDALKSGLNDTIDQLNAELADEVTVRHVDDVRILDHLPTLEVMQAFPVVGVGEGSGSFEDDTGHSMTGRYQLAICVYESDVDRQALATKLRRLRLAVTRLLLAGRVLNDSQGNLVAYGIRPIRLLPGTVLADLDQSHQRVQSFMAWCGLVCEFLADENA
jgi:hypothetical protein